MKTYRRVRIIELVDGYIASRSQARSSTQIYYAYLRGLIAKSSIANAKAMSFSMSQAKDWIRDFQREKDFSFSQMSSLQSVLKLSFQPLEDDGAITRNPFKFKLCGVIKKDAEKRCALTPAQEKSFMDFVKNDVHYRAYYDAFFILLNTGLRISEFAGLTLSDIDLTVPCVHVDHQLQRRGKAFIVEPTKTGCGTRTLPLTEDTARAFERLIAARRSPASEPSIGGLQGFLCLTDAGVPCTASNWEHRLRGAVTRYNATHPRPLPNITPHVFRHTYCSRMARSGMNPKTLQYLMGHSSISVTLDIYTHLSPDDIQTEVLRCAGS